MNVPQNDLDDLARALKTANARLIRAIGSAGRGAAEEAATFAEEARAGVWTCVKQLERLGADAPAPAHVPPMETPLALMDTPANRRLLDALLTAYEAAAEVDRERGHDPADGFAAIIESFCADKRDEIGGPLGAGRE